MINSPPLLTVTPLTVALYSMNSSPPLPTTVLSASPPYPTSTSLGVV